MTDFRSAIHAGLNALIAAPEDAFAGHAQALIAEEAVWDVAWPINRLSGRDAILDGFLRPLRAAIPEVRRRDLLFIGGRNIRAERGDWCAAVSHYVGNQRAPFCGVEPRDQALVFLRAGEFYRVLDGRIVEAKIIFDLPDLMRQLGRPPFPSDLGTEITWPAPATQDGVLPGNREAGAASIAVVNRMVDTLHAYDPETFGSEGQVGSGGVWHDDMMWYGPGGIGSNYRWDGFVRHHRADFLRAFPDRKGGNHYCRIGDGAYAAMSGWPSMTMTHMGDYLGMPATGKALTLRVMDFYRIADNRLIENWVSLDYGDLFHQLGVDIRTAALR